MNIYDKFNSQAPINAAYARDIKGCENCSGTAFDCTEITTYYGTIDVSDTLRFEYIIDSAPKVEINCTACGLEHKARQFSRIAW